jgi:hypothetical protein
MVAIRLNVRIVPKACEDAPATIVGRYVDPKIPAGPALRKRDKAATHLVLVVWSEAKPETTDDGLIVKCSEAHGALRKPVSNNRRREPDFREDRLMSRQNSDLNVPATVCGQQSSAWDRLCNEDVAVEFGRSQIFLQRNPDSIKCRLDPAEFIDKVVKLLNHRT